MLAAQPIDKVCLPRAPGATLHMAQGPEGNLHIDMLTPRLHLRSAAYTPESVQHYTRLMTDPVVMQRFGTGQPLSAHDVGVRIGIWAGRWAEADPYTGLSIYRRDNDTFYGHVVLGHSGVAGQAELAYLACANQWGAGLMTEAVDAVLHVLAPQLQARGFELDGAPLQRIIATARPDNIASCRLLERAGFAFTKRETKFGAQRNHYARPLPAAYNAAANAAAQTPQV